MAESLRLSLLARTNHWVWLGILLALLGATAGMVSSLPVPIAYQATARVQPSWRLAGAVVSIDQVDQFASTLGPRMTSTRNLNEVITKRDLQYSTAILAANINITGDRFFLEQIDVTVTDSDPLRASRIANAVVAAYMREVRSPAETIFIDAAATPPKSSARPNLQLEGLVGGIIGALVSVALFVARRSMFTVDLQGALRRDTFVRKLLPATPRSQQLFSRALVVASAACIVVGAAISGTRSDPTFAFIGFGPLFLLAVAISPVARLAILIIGGLLVFQSSQSLTIAKAAYFGVALTIAAISMVNAWEARRSETFARLRPLLYASAALATLLAISFVVARSHGTETIAWSRDAAPYGLIILSVVLAVDVSVSRPRRIVLELLLIGCGVASAVAYANDWLQHREYGTLPVDLPVVPSFMLSAALFAYATAQVVAGRTRWLWAATAMVVGFLLFVTGSRGTLLILVVPAVVALWSGPVGPAPVLRRLASSLVPAAGAGLLTAGFLYASTLGTALQPANLPAVAAVSPASGWNSTPVTAPAPAATAPQSQPPTPAAQPTPRRLQTRLIASRFEKMLLILLDPSFQERLTVDRLAWTTFLHNPILGVGPGYLYRWPTPGG